MRTPRWISLLFTALAALVAGAPTIEAATGGPDIFGYTWADSDEPNISAATPGIPAPIDLRALGFTGDDTLIQITLPTSVFPTGFPFYGTNYPAFWLSSNGWLSFQAQASSVPASTTQPTPGAPDATLAWYWNDWTLDGSQLLEQAGINSTGDGYSMLLNIYRKSDTGTIGRVFVTLFNTGAIQLVYSVSGADIVGPACQIGIEDQNGTDGLAYMKNGVAQNGALFRNDYAVWFFPKGNLDCLSGVTPLACPTPSTAYSTATGFNRVRAYNCSALAWDGNEKVFSLTLTTAANLSAQLSNFGPRTLGLFFIRPSCSEFTGCMVGGTTTVAPQFVAPGTYYLVVDGARSNDNGGFNLALTCQDAVTGVACGQTLLAESLTGVGTLSNWSCAPGLTGPERVYSVNVPLTSTLRATLSSSTVPGGQVLLSDPATFTTTAPTCFASSATTVQQWSAGPGATYISVDGLGAGTYDLAVECERRLQCPSPAQTLSLTAPVPVVGDTTGKLNNVESYYCSSSNYGVGPLVSGNYTGPEDVYEFDVMTPTVVSFLFSPESQGMRLLILRDCYEGSCVMEGGCSETLPPGHYRLVVDGIGGAAGRYTITPLPMPIQPYNQWSACAADECKSNCTHSPTEISNRDWHFNSGNYCGTGCNFSLFAVVECGSEFHIPFLDVETGHMQIFDLFKQQYVTLTATNDLPVNGPPPAACKLTSTGTTVEWEDNTCSAVPCPAANCGGGRDCRTNNRVMDVSFNGTPNVCGVYRIDFIEWGGFDWHAYANCTADTTQQYPLYRDLCTAVAAYRPLPEVGISNVTLSAAQCAAGTASGTMTIENVGCLPAASAEVTIDVAPPAPSNPKVYQFNLDKGSTQVVPWDYTPTTVPAQLVFRVDPGNQVLECSENSGTSVSCGFNSVLQRTVNLVACGVPCTTSASAGPPQALCEGSPVTLDGSGSTLTCSLGAPQYRWEDGAGNPVAGCDWGASATCNVPPLSLVPGVNNFTLRTRCQNENPPCESVSSTTVTITANAVPPSMGNVLKGTEARPDALWQWTALTGSPITAYRLYRDGTKDVAFATRTKIFDVPLSTLSVTESGALAAPPAVAYYELVAASCLGDLESPY